MIKTRFEILVELYPENRWIANNDGIQNLDNVEIDENRVNEIISMEPFRLLRLERTRRLDQSDWMAVSDRTMTQAQIDYRQALRDLPQTADPQLDENGNLTNVTWPTYE